MSRCFAGSEPGSDDAFWARHHLQGPAPIDVGSRYVSLNDLHVPTGPVPIEEIIRFCINDLGVAPMSDKWDAILVESIEVSRQNSASQLLPGDANVCARHTAYAGLAQVGSLLNKR